MRWSGRPKGQPVLPKIVSFLNRLAIALSSGVLLGMMLLACSNMILRFFGFPVMGTFELMGFGGAIIASLALGGTQEKKGHIEVNLIEQVLPTGCNLFIRLVSLCMAAGLFCLMAWRLLLLAGILHSSGEVSETLHLDYSFVVVLVALGVGLLIATLLAQILQLLKEGKDAP